MLGLYFVGCARALSSDQPSHKKHSEHPHSAHAHRLVLQEQNLSDIERDMLKSIKEQVESKEAPQSTRTCMECGRPFVLINVNGVEVDYCAPCRSCWFDDGELMAIAGTWRDVPSDDLKSRESRFNCPVCGDRMREYVYRKPYSLLVDKCVHNHGVYLQDRELEQVFELT